MVSHQENKDGTSLDVSNLKPFTPAHVLNDYRRDSIVTQSLNSSSEIVNDSYDKKKSSSYSSSFLPLPKLDNNREEDSLVPTEFCTNHEQAGSQVVEFQFDQTKRSIYSTKETASVPKLNVYSSFKLMAEDINPSTDHLAHTASPTASATASAKEAIVEEEVKDGSDDNSSDDAGWKEMDTEISYTIYDNKGEKIDASIKQQIISQKKDDAPDGYTRINAEEQAQKYEEIDKKMDFLFEKENSNLNRLLNGSHDVEHYEEEDVYSDDDDYTPLSQLDTTKKMLKESQKVAYVGLVQLCIVEMGIALAEVHGTQTRTMGKKLSKAHATFSSWASSLMTKLHKHIGLSEEEQLMIEKLSTHGVRPEDMTPSLLESRKIENPLHQNDIDGKLQSHQHKNTESSAKDVLSPEDIADKKMIDIDVRWTVICDLFLILLSGSIYDSRSRTLLLLFSRHLNLTTVEICQFERRITDSLEMNENNPEDWNEEEILTTRKRIAKKRKYMYVGIATIGGGLVIGLSAGLFAPVIGAGIAAGLSTVGITGASGFLAGVGGTALVTTTGVVTGARIGSKGMLKRVGDVKTFQFRPLHNNGRVNLIITVSGWMNSKGDDVRLPFSTVDPVMGDLYSVFWEPELLQSMGQTISILATEALTQSIQQILGNTILVALMSSIQLPMALSKLGYLLDNPWNVSLDRAWKAGLVLADNLMNRNLGVRPVTLVGFSLGARVIYSCLLHLSKNNAYGLVEDVILMGTPIVSRVDELALARATVSGRFVNCYSKTDWILGYLFRLTSSGIRSVAGLSAVELIPGIENLDCTEWVEGHMAYRKAIPKIMATLGWQVISEEFVDIDEPDLKQTERQRKLIIDFEEARKKMLEEDKTKKKKGWSWLRPKKKEWWDVYDEGRKEVEKKKKQEVNKDDDGSDVNGETLPEELKESGEEASNEEAVLFDVDALNKEIETIEQTEIERMQNKSQTTNLSKEEPHMTQTSPESNKLKDLKLPKRKSVNSSPEGRRTTSINLNILESPISKVEALPPIEIDHIRPTMGFNINKYIPEKSQLKESERLDVNLESPKTPTMSAHIADDDELEFSTTENITMSFGP
ncbi:Putative lipase [Komagataella phaffii CBS 7435]|uniref:Putative lipase n=1 Tax=Komagataella phaffii (strain ATCC 76273 / CBS 7435 / CECT 11047 / NRRL Y-11430 / Wegner 21-1) TaxID=981350 RepID=F2QXA6_KOMPC|nr:GQ67_03162T0 [Komagataella phaffii]AOA69288.1 GQ68_03147T0 [Komagataella phaffii GS115]CAH2450155.1 Putative lipase [Komagataella phaffii CBS 7435]CCA40034.1 Putative lipase [Komagataella phaffii CBS 7435]